MADQVKFIHQALGESTISNMATEATLKELLEAIGGGQTPSSRSNSLLGLKNPFKSLASKAKSLENAIKGTMRPFTGFVSLLGKGEVQMSKFGHHLNDSVIKKLPGVGGLFGAVGNVVFTSVGVLESWNTESKKLAPSGATFGNSLLEFAQISAMTRMSLDELNSVVGSNIEKFVGLGPNLNQGVRNFASFSDAFFRPGNVLNEKLYNMGYGFREINENMVDFLFYTQRTRNNTINTNMAVQDTFFQYMRNLDMLTKIFGKSSQEVNQASAKILKDSIYQIKLNQENEKVGAKATMGAQTLTMVFGESVAGVFKAQMYGMNIVAGESMDLSLMLSDNLRPLVKQLTDAAKDENVEPEEFRDLTLDVITEAIFLTKGNLEQKRKLLETISVSGEGFTGGYDAIRNAAAVVLRTDLKDKTKAQVRADLAEAFKQQDRTETIKEIIDAMKQAATYFKGEFQEVLIEELKGLGNAFEQYDLPELFRKAGAWAADWTVKAWGQIQDFFKMLGTAGGRTFLVQTFENMISHFGNAFTRTIKDIAKSIVQSIVPESVDSTVSGMNDRIREKFGIDIPFIRTDKDSAIEKSQDDFLYGVNEGRLKRLYALTTMENPYATQGGAIMDGTVIYPDYASMGSEDLGPLIWKDNKWQSKKSVDLMESVEKYYQNPYAMSYGGGMGLMQMSYDAQNAAKDADKFLKKNAERMDLLGQRTSLGLGTGVVYSSSLNRLVTVNAKYADKFQSLIDLLEGVFGLKFTSLGASPDGSLARLDIKTERFGSEWFTNLTETQQQMLIQGMVQQGLLGSGELFGREAGTSQIMAETNMRLSGKISALYRDGGIHKDENKFRTGLENTGRLFNDFGRGKKVNLSGDKAIMTEEQYNIIKDKGASQIPVKDIVNSVNSSVQEMIRLTKVDIAFSKSILNVA